MPACVVFPRQSCLADKRVNDIGPLVGGIFGCGGPQFVRRNHAASSLDRKARCVALQNGNIGQIDEIEASPVVGTEAQHSL